MGIKLPDSTSMATTLTRSRPTPGRAAGYQPVSAADDDHDGRDDTTAAGPPLHGPAKAFRPSRRAVVVVLVACVALGLAVKFVADGSSVFADVAAASKGQCHCAPSPDVPQYFQTSPELWAGPTATGKAPFLRQTVTFDPTATYVPNAPLQTAIPIQGMTSDNTSIFEMMGYLSPYSPSPGFGVSEYPLPAGAEILQVQMLSRHGSRYPTKGANVVGLGDRIHSAKKDKRFKASGPLDFLNDWKYQLGHEILVPRGRQELFDSGILHAYNYMQLYNANSRIIVRTTTQDRMLKSAEYFLAGFFGLEWTRNATIEVIIEQKGFNNSLAGYLNCPNSRKSESGNEAMNIWIDNYLQNATARLRPMIDGYTWTIEDSFAAMNMCPYETVAYGFSRFCDLFTYEEWIGFSYAIDLGFAGNVAFQSPVGRATGIGYQQETMARLKNHTLGYSGSQINVTLDNNTETFPLNQTLYFDFSHDTNIVSILTAFGLRQFSQLLPPSSYPGKHNMTISHIVPFGARLDIEIIRTPKPLAADRSGYVEGGETKYVHFVLNQRTLPLGWSLPECDASRVDGWCEFEAFVSSQEKMAGLAKYDHACFGQWDSMPYGSVTDGSPP
ncbi:hypothetical protein RB595_000886 [Gaeumannomyces hyphopodioides]